MIDEDFSKILNNSKALTIGQILKLISKIKYSALIMIITTFLAITGSAYMAGQSNIKHEIAVMLHSPFSMRITINENDHDFDNLTLIEDPMIPSPLLEKTMLSLRQIRSDFDIIPIGQIIAFTNKKETSSIWEWIFAKLPKISNTAYAQPKKIFSWNRHQGDFKFKERHVDDHTIHRYYYDQCKLEYKIDSNRRSIPESFRWIKKTH